MKKIEYSLRYKAILLNSHKFSQPREFQPIENFSHELSYKHKRVWWQKMVFGELLSCHIIAQNLHYYPYLAAVKAR